MALAFRHPPHHQPRAHSCRAPSAQQQQRPPHVWRASFGGGDREEEIEIIGMPNTHVLSNHAVGTAFGVAREAAVSGAPKCSRSRRNIMCAATSLAY